jgi:hypothetical protein
MKNSYVCAILGLYRGIFADLRVNLPTACGVERDENRLLSTVMSRGIRYLTIDMPAFGKHFDRCLADGRLVPSGLPNFGYGHKGSRSHSFLSGLLSRVFDKGGLLMEQPCLTSIFFIRQLCNGAKKIKVDCSEKVRNETLQTYLLQERSLRSPSLNWHGDRPDRRWGERLRIDDFRNNDCGEHSDLFAEVECTLDANYCATVHDVADRVVSSFGLFSAAGFRPKHGPGAVADAKRGGYKYNFPTWSARLEAVFPSSELAYANYDWWVDAVQCGTVPREEDLPSIALTVPKSQLTPRIIAKEPVANMWCQQILRDYLEEQVNNSVLSECISFRDQTKNQDCALEASRTGEHWTIDLSSASDRVSLWLVERLFRTNPGLLEALSASRSRYCKVPTSDGDNYLLMKKFAPQGAATTFPLQTIIYSILCISAVIHSRGWTVSSSTIRVAAKEVQVFGDDTVIPSDCGRQYVELLTYCGFLVNYSKTYGTGKFRESCGVEAYDGVDVTPAYITYPYDESAPSSVASTVECSNNFFMKGLWHTAAALESTLPHWMRKHLRVVGPGEGVFGLKSFVGSQSTPFTRYNESLQRYECLALGIRNTVSRTQPGGAGHLLQYFTEKPTQDIHWMSGVDGQASSRVAKKWEPIPFSSL